MRVLVAYASQYGSTKGIAERIGCTIHKHGLDVELRSADANSINLADPNFDAYVIGSAIHAGHWLKSAIEFVEKNENELARRPAWLFSSGPIGEKYVHKPQPEPPEVGEARRLIAVRDHAVFGGSFDPTTADLTKGNWIERQIAKRFMPAGDFRDWAEIEAWANAIAQQLSPISVAA